MKQKLIIVAVAVAITAISILGFSGVKQKGSGNNEIRIVEGFSRNNSMSKNYNKDQIKKIARRENMTVRQVEDIIASSIENMRKLSMDASGGLGPGVHIINSVNSARLDPSKIKIVPISSVINFDDGMNKKEGYNSPDKFQNDQRYYIEPAVVDETSLKNAKFLGYYVEGKYLRGSEYASTERLKFLERTPSGKSGWTGISRIFSDYLDIGTVILRESDNIAAGVTVRITKNSINSNIEGYPATLIRLQDASGKSMSAVQWYGPQGRTNSLHIKQTDDRSVAAMMRLANEIARPIG